MFNFLYLKYLCLDHNQLQFQEFAMLITIRLNFVLLAFIKFHHQLIIFSSHY